MLHRPVAVWSWVLCAVGCGGSPGGSRASTTPGPADPERPMSVVTSSIVIDACPASNRVDTKRAGKEIESMVAHCRHIPGGKAHFSATLMPGGRVQLGSPAGDPDAGVIPTCLLQATSPLRHQLRLSKPCQLEVHLEETASGPTASEPDSAP